MVYEPGDRVTGWPGDRYVMQTRTDFSDRRSGFFTRINVGLIWRIKYGNIVETLLLAIFRNAVNWCGWYWWATTRSFEFRPGVSAVKDDSWRQPMFRVSLSRFHRHGNVVLSLAAHSECFIHGTSRCTSNSSQSFRHKIVYDKYLAKCDY